VTYFLFANWLKDTLYIPIYLLGLIVSPWRFVLFHLKVVYRYNNQGNIKDSIKIGRELLYFRVLVSGLRDLIILIETIFIILTVIRLVFFIMFLRAN